MTGNHHEADDLIALLRGDLGRQQLTSLAGHLRGCETCRRSLVEVAAVHGSLEAAARLLGQPAGSPGLTQPSGSPEPMALSASDLPPLRLPRRRTSRLALVAAGVAAVAVLGAGGVLALSPRRPQPPAGVASVALRPLTGDAAGRVTMSGPSPEVHMTISTARLPSAGSGRFYFAWLLDPRSGKMLPLGVVTADRTEGFDVSADLVRRYHAVDISLESDNGDPAHSVTSVLRASY